MTEVLLAFIGASLVITASPGPDTLVVLRNAAAGGRRAAAWTTMGVLVGGLAWMIAVVAGLAALVRSSESVYTVLRYVGAAYLAYLGLRSLRQWWLARSAPATAGPWPGAPDGTAPTGPEAPWSTWAREGLLTNLLNAKLGAFLVAFFPQFTVPGMSPTAGNLVLAAVFWAIAVLWFGSLLLAIRALGSWLSRPEVRRAIGGVSGAILVVMAALVAVGH